MARMKEQIKIPEKELNEIELTNLTDAEFKTLVIRMLTEMTEYRHKIEEEVKTIQSVMRKNMQGTNSKGNETGTHISDLK